VRSKYLFLGFLFILVMSFFLFPSVKGIIDIPISANDVIFDGNVSYWEWSDAYHIRLNSFDGGYFDFYLKYDEFYEELQIGFIVDDSDYSEIDRIGFFFDTQNNGGTDTDLDDFALIIYRQSTSIFGFYPYPIDSIYIEGAGSGFFTGDSYYDPSSLPAPFDTFYLVRNETNPEIDLYKGGAYGASWEGEFHIGLSKVYVQDESGIEIGFGLEYWNNDYYDNYVDGRWYPPELTNSPSTWETLFIQQSQPALSVSFVTPSSGTSLGNYPVKLAANVTSNGSPVYDAIANFYVDGVLAGFDYTNTSGYVSYDYYPSEGAHTWYIEVEKTGYLGNTSFLQSFTYNLPIPELFISQMSPSSEATFDSSPIEFKAQVAADGSSVNQARVDFYIGGEYVGYEITDNSGFANIFFEPYEGTYSWFVTASKSGYIEGISSLHSFSYEIQRFYLSINSAVYIQGQGNYESGETVTLSAYDVVENLFILKKFDYWLIDGIINSNNVVSFPIESDTTVNVIWETDYTRLFLAGLMGFGLLVLGVYYNQLNKKKKETEKEKLLIESELRSVKDSISRKLNIDDSYSPINLLEEVRDYVTADDAKKTLDEIVSEKNVLGWYTGEYLFITNKTLKNSLIFGISKSLEKNETFDITIYSREHNLDLGLINEIIESLIEDDVLVGQLSTDNKFIWDSVLKEKIGKYLRK